MALPEPTAEPCNDCPWRKVSAEGWLGPLDATEWAGLVLGDAPIACHLTIHEVITRYEDWPPEMRQCAGAADFRANICKSPRDPEVAKGSPNEAVFGGVTEFLEHHTGHSWSTEETRNALNPT